MAEARSQWKVVDLVMRMAGEDPYDLVRSEMERVAGRLEARGLQRVRVKMEYASADENELRIEMSGMCPCGAERLATVEDWPLDIFRDGPHTIEARLTQIELAMLNRLGAPVGAGG